MSRRPYSIILILPLLLGCAVQPIPRTEPVTVPLPPVRVLPEPPIKQDPFQAFPWKYRQQALEYERNQDLRKALFIWKVVRSFVPKDPEASERIETLEEQIGIEAEKHFRKGVDFFREKSTYDAQKQFLIALAYNPDHAAALDYLKHGLTEPDFILYETREGDSLRRIAREVYKDAEMDFLIAYFNDLGSGAELKPGKTLKLPLVEPDMIAKPQPRQEMPAPTIVLKPEKYKLDQGEMHYQKGVNYFLAQELDKAIEEWIQTLQLNPDHPKAKKDLERARRLQEKLKKF